MSESAALAHRDRIEEMEYEHGLYKSQEEARHKELEYIKDKKVWTKIPRAVAISKKLKVVKGRWIDINKGDDRNPIYRSRYMAKEFNAINTDGLFAGTPPLKALRYLLHEAAAISGGKRRR